MSEEKKTILVIDDEPDTVRFFTLVLEDNGYKTISATGGAEGLSKAIKHQPDLITLDINMPEKSGVKLYRDFCDDPAIAKIPVVIITGLKSEFQKFIENRRQVPPPAGYLSKPIEEEDLLATISKLL